MHRIIPIEFKNENGALVPSNPGLSAAADAFCEKEFGRKLDLRVFLKVWVDADIVEDTLLAVHGMIALRSVFDTPVFHVSKPSEYTLDAAKDFVRINDSLIDRARNWIIDQGGTGLEVFVHVSKDSWNEKALKRNLDRLQARESNRVIVDLK